MTWVKLDDSMPLHPKVLPLTDGAFRVHVSAICHCARAETDGRVTTALAKASGWTKRSAELVGAGLWDVVDGGWDIHDYLEYNPSREQLEGNRDAARQRMTKARGARGAQTVTPPVRANFAGTSPEPTPKFAVGSPNPVPSRPVPSRDPERDRPRAVTRLVSPNLSTDQGTLLDYLHERVTALILFSNGPPTGWCEDLIRRGAARSDVDHAVHTTVARNLSGNGRLGYVRSCLEERVKTRESGEDPDARPNDMERGEEAGAGRGGGGGRYGRAGDRPSGVGRVPRDRLGLVNDAEGFARDIAENERARAAANQPRAAEDVAGTQPFPGERGRAGGGGEPPAA